jgi:hypothetical protein
MVEELIAARRQYGFALREAYNVFASWLACEYWIP